MIGLISGSTMLANHDLTWQFEAENTIQVLKSMLSFIAIDIQHVGSTSIPGIKAKPILDLVVGVKELDDVLPYVDVLYSAGFLFKPEHESDWELFFVCNQASLRTHHIHVVRHGSEHWYQFILFRDQLLHHHASALAYEHLKTELAKQYPNDRPRYTEGKAIFIRQTIELAKSMLPLEKSCGAVLFTTNHNVRHYLLIESLRGNFGFPKGHIEGDETEHQTAHREIWEETGLHVHLLEGFREEAMYFLDATTRKQVVYFLASFDPTKVVIQQSEVKSYRILPYELARQLLRHEQDRLILDHAEHWLVGSCPLVP